MCRELRRDSECAVQRSNHLPAPTRTPSRDPAGAAHVHEQCLCLHRERRSRSDWGAIRRICPRSGSDLPFRYKNAAAFAGDGARKSPADRAHAWRSRPSRCEAVWFVRLVEREVALKRWAEIARIKRSRLGAAYGAKAYAHCTSIAQARQTYRG